MGQLFPTRGPFDLSFMTTLILLSTNQVGAGPMVRHSFRDWLIHWWMLVKPFNRNCWNSTTDAPHRSDKKFVASERLFCSNSLPYHIPCCAKNFLVIIYSTWMDILQSIIYFWCFNTFCLVVSVSKVWGLWDSSASENLCNLPCIKNI